MSLAITDAYGQTSVQPTRLRLVINAVPGPTPVVNNGTDRIVVVNTTAGGSGHFDNSGTTCPAGGCTTYWSLSCPEGRGSFVNRTGNSITVTTGTSNSADVNTAGATSPFICERDGVSARREQAQRHLF